MKKPKTIADLKFNWVFVLQEGKYSSQIISDFIEMNSHLVKYVIQKGEYSFHVKGQEFSCYCHRQSLPDFFEDINYHVCQRFKSRRLNLINFELIADNTFKIYVA